MHFSVWLWSILAGIFGATVGSFLNVLIYRIPRESLSIVRPKRSFCPACGKAIIWYDNIPLLSFVVLKGRCRSCGTSISPTYFLVELLTAILFFGLTWYEAPAVLNADMVDQGPGKLTLISIYVVHLVVIAVILVVTFIDMKFQIIPDEITYPGMLLAPLLCAILPGLQGESSLYLSSLNPHLAGFLSSLGGALIGGGTLFLVGFIGSSILKKEALGLGDVKYMFFVGGIVGWEGVLIVFFLGCALGSLIGVPLRLFSGKQEIPFGPFLSFGVLMVLFFRADILDLLLNKWPAWVRLLFD